MSTTSLVVEILVIGLQASVWVALLLAASLKGDATFCVQHYTNVAAGPSPLVTAAVLAQAYALGIVMDLLARRIVGLIEWGTGCHEQVGDENLSIQDAEEKLYVKVAAKRDDVLPDILLRRSKMKIMRALMLNAPCITASTLIFLSNGSHQHWRGKVGFIGLAATIVACWGFLYVRRFHMKGMKDYLDELPER